MSKESKVRAHKLSRNKSLPAVVIVTLLMMFGYFYMAQIVIGSGLTMPVILLFGSGTIDEKMNDPGLVGLMESASTTVALFASIALLFFYYHWFKPEFNWKLRKSSLGWKLAAPILIYWIVYFGIAYTVLSGNFTFGIPAYKDVIFTVAAGVCEEVSFRAIGISYMKRQRRGEKYILPILLFVSVAFGLTHLTNAIKVGHIGAFALQSALATMLGIFFGAVYLRTGNIIPCIIVHGLHDFLVTAFSVNKHFKEMPTGVFAISIICELLLAIWGLYLVRKEKQPEIEALWNEKWRLSETEHESIRS